MREVRRVGWVLLVASLAACSSLLGDDDGTSAAPTADADPAAPDADPAAPDATPLADAAPATLGLAAIGDVDLERGTTIDVAIEVSRGAGVSGAVEVTVAGLPAGVSAAPLSLAASVSEGTLRLTATAGASLGSTQPVVRAEVAGGAPSAMQPLGLTVFRRSGQLVTSWGEDGVYEIPGSSRGLFFVEPDGLMRGAYDATNEVRFFVVEPDGVLDTTYGGMAFSSLRGLIPRPAGGWTVICSDAAGFMLRNFDTTPTNLNTCWSNDVSPHTVGLARHGSGFLLFAPTLVARVNQTCQRDTAWHDAPSTGGTYRSFTVHGANTYAGGYDAAGKRWAVLIDGDGDVVRALTPADRAGWSIDALDADADGVVLAAANREASSPLLVERRAADGTLIATFVQVTPLAGKARGVEILADGRVLVAGDQYVARFLADGTLDPTFGTGGLVRVVTTGNIFTIDVAGDALYVAVGSDAAPTGTRILKFTND